MIRFLLTETTSRMWRGLPEAAQRSNRKAPPRLRQRYLRGRARAAVAVLALLTLSGCGATCTQIADDEAAFRAASASASGPHLAMFLPASQLDQFATDELKSLGAVTVPTTGLGQVDKYVGKLELVPKSVTFVPGSNDGLAARLDMDVRLGGKRITGFDATVDLQPRVDTNTQTMSIGIGPEALRSISPTLGADAQLAFVDDILGRLPAAVRAFIPKDVVAGAADQLVAEVVNQGWALLRDNVLSGVGELAAIEVRLGGLPIADTWWHRVGDHVRIDVQTSLPVARAMDTRSLRPPSAHRSAVHLGGFTVAALANEAMVRGMIPRRFDTKGNAAPTGPVTAGIAWGDDDKPFKIRTWQKSGVCLSATIEGVPSVEVHRDQLTVKVTDGSITDVSGPPLIEMGAWLQNLWADAIEYSASVATKAELDAGSRHIRLEVVGAKRDGDVIELELDVAATRARRK